MPRSCVEAKQYLPLSVDGEFWLELKQHTDDGLKSVNVRVYCHNITRPAPTYYITLKDADSNYGSVYKDRVKGVADDDCAYNGDRLIHKKHGRTAYTKIRISVFSFCQYLHGNVHYMCVCVCIYKSTLDFLYQRYMHVYML